MQIREMMSRDVRTCLGSDSLNDAARIMWESDCGCVPVVDGDGRVVGIVTDRDICMAAYIRGLALGEMTVDTAASKKMVTIHEDESLHAAEQRMHDAQIRRLPVVDSNDRLVGLLSLSDFARRVRELGDGIPGHIVGALAGISARRSPRPAPRAQETTHDVSQATAELRREFKKSLDLLRTLRDDVRVRLHLGGLDLRDQWKKLEPHLGDVERRAGELTEASRSALADAVKKLEHFRSSLSDRA